MEDYETLKLNKFDPEVDSKIKNQAFEYKESKIDDVKSSPKKKKVSEYKSSIGMEDKYRAPIFSKEGGKVDKAIDQLNQKTK